VADILTPDLCVIGGGAGGIAVAELARSHGASVILIEAGRLGGSALNTGAVPARALAAAAATAQGVRDAGRFGIAVDEPKPSFRRIHDHVEQVIGTLAPGVAAERLQTVGVEVIAGRARFVSRSALAVGEAEIRARKFVIATGSRAAVPDIPGLDAVPYFTADTILDNTRKLTHLVVIGGSADALMLAQAYRRLGSAVTLIANGPLLAGMDPELVGLGLEQLQAEGVVLLIEASVVAVQARSMGTGVVIRERDVDRPLDASHVLVAGDRVPMLDGLEPETAGIRRDQAGQRLVLNAALRTTNSRVYAVGDVVGSHSVPSARHQAERVVRHALNAGAAGSATLPRLVAVDPPVAEIGLNEAEARARHGSRFHVTRVSYAENDAARAESRARGVAKLLTDKSGRIIGAGVVGPGASELIALFALAMTAGIPATKLADMPVPYPSHADIAVRLVEEVRRATAGKPFVQRLAGLGRLIR